MLIADRLRHELEEDLTTAWVPDALDWVDLPTLTDSTTKFEQMISPLSIPRPSGGALTVYALPVDLVVRLHRAVDQLRDPADAMLAPSVCGYRRGSESGPGYRREHSRFIDFVRSELESNLYAGQADVATFFACISHDLVIGAVEDVSPAATEDVAGFVSELRTAGVVGLPPGYGDARLLSNLVLANADASIARIPFCRWVDDYRIFGGSEAHVASAIASLGAALSDIGLQLNKSKTRTATAAAMLAESGRSLESVFHPEREPILNTSVSLRAVFAAAASDPIKYRREIRFSLRRLGSISDPIAIAFALDGLVSMPWELPRLVDYLASFAVDRHVREAVESNVLSAADSLDDWRMARLLPLAIAIGTPSAAVISSVANYALRTGSAPIWGLAIRFLSIAGRREALELCRSERDPRAALAVYADLNVTPPASLAARAPETAALLVQSVAPPPSPRSIL